MQYESKNLRLATKVLQDMANTPHPPFKRRKVEKVSLCEEEKEILLMRLLYEQAGWNVKQLQDCFGKQLSTVQRIVNYENYKHILTEGFRLSEEALIMSQMEVM